MNFDLANEVENLFRVRVCVCFDVPEITRSILIRSDTLNSRDNQKVNINNNNSVVPLAFGKVINFYFRTNFQL